MFIRMGLIDTIEDFAANTGIHGLAFLVNKKYSLKQRLFWAAVFFSLAMYASLQLRIAVFCKILSSKNLFYIPRVYLRSSFLAWYSHPVKSVTLVYPIKNVIFPTVTICPENSNPDRWGPAIKVFDHLKLSCKDQK